MAPAPLDRPEFDRWSAAAGRALAAADAQTAHEIHEWACFLAEQAAQLALKGLLHGIGAAAWGHDLAALEEHVAAAIGAPWPHDAANRAERLSRFYIPTRYPDAIPGGVPGDRFGAADAAAARVDAVALIEAAQEAWRTLEGGT